MTAEGVSNEEDTMRNFATRLLSLIAAASTSGLLLSLAIV